MYCFDCQSQGRTTVAAGICTSCGAGVCAGCVQMEFRDHSTTAGPGTPTPHRTRSLTCQTCDAVLRAGTSHYWSDALPGLPMH